ncbi:MAG: clostripain-related cysteine peptidase [Bacteroidales bacterium]|nr:clostripain-related cysteine peptidase [Bacteroidales bacterium]
MKNIVLYLKAAIIFSLLFFTSCKEDEPKNPKEEISRTVLVYMAGENNLSYYATLNVDSILVGMNKVEKPINFLVFEDKKSLAPNLWKIEKDLNGNSVKTLVKTYTEFNSVDPQKMKDVINEVFSKYNANEKCLILWSHGTAWLPSNNYTLPSAPVQRSFGQDNANYLEIWDLRKVLEGTPYLDLLIFDACFMSSAETLYELKDAAKTIIASPTEILGAGFPYQVVVPYLNETTLDPKKICTGYMSFYNGYKFDGTISLIDCNYLDELAAVYKKVLDGADYSNISESAIQEFGRREPNFLNDFYDMENVVEVINPALLPEFKAVMGKVVKYNNYTKLFLNLEINRCCGISVFVPQLNTNSTYNKAYTALKWHEAVYE